jgi:hypothetical protein
MAILASSLHRRNLELADHVNFSMSIVSGPLNRYFVMKFSVLFVRSVALNHLILSGLILGNLIAPNFTSSAIAHTETFGTPGRGGMIGRSGRNGTTANNQDIRATGTPLQINLMGSEGENGEDATAGENANNCWQSDYPAYNLRGADGGDGGHGGHGGNGGNGGSSTIFYSTIDQLRNLQLNHLGGRGGRGGRGGQAGRGCYPERREWSIDRCEWALMQRPKQDPNAPWQERHREHVDCADGHERSRPATRRGKTFEYNWEFRGVSGHSRYQATAGRDGNHGNNGSDGSNGQAGNVYLVMGEQIPTENLSYNGAIATTIGNPINLLKNNWRSQNGLQQLLAPGSNVRDDYQQLQTVRHQLVVDWKAPQSFAALGNPTISTAIDGNGDLSTAIPGHLEYRQVREGSRTKLTVMNGIAPDRLKQVKFRGFEQFQNARSFALIDEGKLLKEITQMEIQVKVSSGNNQIEDSYAISQSNGSMNVSQNIEALANIYKVQLGEKFTPLLTAGNALTYEIRIRQITRSGAPYDSQIRVKQVVDQVTFPKVEYFAE